MKKKKEKYNWEQHLGNDIVEILIKTKRTSGFTANDIAFFLMDDKIRDRLMKCDYGSSDENSCDVCNDRNYLNCNSKRYREWNTKYQKEIQELSVKHKFKYISQINHELDHWHNRGIFNKNEEPERGKDFPTVKRISVYSVKHEEIIKEEYFREETGKFVKNYPLIYRRNLVNKNGKKVQNILGKTEIIEHPVIIEFQVYTKSKQDLKYDDLIKMTAKNVDMFQQNNTHSDSILVTFLIPPNDSKSKNENEEMFKERKYVKDIGSKMYKILKEKLDENSS